MTMPCRTHDPRFLIFRFILACSLMYKEGMACSESDRISSGGYSQVILQLRTNACVLESLHPQTKSPPSQRQNKRPMSHVPAPKFSPREQSPLGKTAKMERDGRPACLTATCICSLVDGLNSHWKSHLRRILVFSYFTSP